MIVLKATQDKILSVLQSVAGIIERRHTLPILADVLLRKAGVVDLEQAICHRPLASVSRQWGACFGTLSARSNGFFSASNANLRNAP